MEVNHVGRTILEFSDGEVIEIDDKQYAEIVAYILHSVCGKCAHLTEASK